MVSLKDELVEVRRVWDAGMGRGQVGAPQGRRRSRRNGPEGPVLPPPAGGGSPAGRPACGGQGPMEGAALYCGIL